MGDVATRLRTAVEALDCADLDPGLRVTVSLGVTEWTAADPDLATVAKRADDSLYRAKQNGRNRVELAAARVEDVRKARERMGTEGA